MGRPPNSAARVEEVNASLRSLLGDEATVPRSAWDRILAKHYRIGVEMTQSLTKTGEALGYWVREWGPAGGLGGGRRPGVVRLLPQANGPPAPTSTS